MNYKESVFAIGEVVRFVTDPDIKAMVTGVIWRAGGASFIVSDKGTETEVCVEELMAEDDWVLGVDCMDDDGEVET
jgi:hypothetical protein